MVARRYFLLTGRNNGGKICNLLKKRCLLQLSVILVIDVETPDADGHLKTHSYLSRNFRKLSGKQVERFF